MQNVPKQPTRTLVSTSRATGCLTPQEGEWYFINRLPYDLQLYYCPPAGCKSLFFVGKLPKGDILSISSYELPCKTQRAPMMWGGSVYAFFDGSNNNAMAIPKYTLDVYHPYVLVGTATLSEYGSVTGQSSNMRTKNPGVKIYNDYFRPVNVIYRGNVIGILPGSVKTRTRVALPDEFIFFDNQREGIPLLTDIEFQDRETGVKLLSMVLSSPYTKSIRFGNITGMESRFN